MNSTKAAWMNTKLLAMAALAAVGAVAVVAPSGASADIRVSSWQAAQANVNIWLKRPTVTLGARRHRLVVSDTRTDAYAYYRNGRTSWILDQYGNYRSGAEQHSEGGFSRRRGTARINGVRAQLWLEGGEVGDSRTVRWRTGGVTYEVSNAFNCRAAVSFCRSVGVGQRVMPWKNILKIARSLKAVH